jgi:microcin C transport system substrate-binding protein
LKALGIATTLRKVDPAQYERRRKSFDYDIVTARFVMQLTPGPELRNYFSSAAAKAEASFNLAGISDPVVDDLLGRIAQASTREELVTAARVLDRVLRAGNYWVSHWYKASHTMAIWDKFGRPAIKPAFDRGIIDTWWIDEAKARRLKQN